MFQNGPFKGRPWKREAGPSLEHHVCCNCQNLWVGGVGRYWQLSPKGQAETLQSLRLGTRQIHNQQGSGLKAPLCQAGGKNEVDAGYYDIECRQSRV